MQTEQKPADLHLPQVLGNFVNDKFRDNSLYYIAVQMQQFGHPPCLNFSFIMAIERPVPSMNKPRHPTTGKTTMFIISLPTPRQYRESSVEIRCSGHLEFQHLLKGIAPI